MCDSSSMCEQVTIIINHYAKFEYKGTRNDVYETLCPQPFACQEGFISFQCQNLQRAIT